MFAELTGLEIGSIITGFVFGAIGLLIAGVSAFKKQEVRVDQPLNVQLLETFVAKSEFTNHVTENKKDFEAMRNELREDRKNNEIHASQRSSGIYKKIDDVREELSEKIDQMPSKIIADLRNAKGLLE